MPQQPASSTDTDSPGTSRNAAAGPLQHATRRPADLRLVEGRETVVEQDHPADSPGAWVAGVAGEPATEVVGVDRRQAAAVVDARELLHQPAGGRLPAGPVDEPA